MYDRVEDLPIGSVAYVVEQGYLVVITGVDGDNYTAVNSYGRDILLPKSVKLSFRSEDLRKDNVHYLDMSLYASAVEDELNYMKKLDFARENKSKFYKRVVENPPNF